MFEKNKTILVDNKKSSYMCLWVKATLVVFTTFISFIFMIYFALMIYREVSEGGGIESRNIDEIIRAEDIQLCYDRGGIPIRSISDVEYMIDCVFPETSIK